MERGVYREQGLLGVVDFYIYDSNGLLICKAQMTAGYACELTEARLAGWLDLKDPIEPRGVTAPSDAYRPPSEVSQAA